MWKNKKGKAIKAAFLAGTFVASAFPQSVSSYKSMGSSWAAYLLVPFGILSSVIAYSYFAKKERNIGKNVEEDDASDISSKNEVEDYSYSSSDDESVSQRSTDGEVRIEQNSVPESVHNSENVKETEKGSTSSVYKILLPVGLFFFVVFIYCLASGKLSFKKKSNEKILNDNDVKENNFVEKSDGEYFEAVFGESEEDFRKKLKEGKGFRKDENENIIMINSKNDREYCAGKIEFKSLGKLREKGNIAVNAQKKGKGSISILGISKGWAQASEELRSKIDVSCLQGDKKNNGAVFLLASNWNTVELLGSYDLVENKKITGAGQSSYFDDGTQAPPARLGTLPGTVACHDLINMDKYHNDSSKWAQTSEGDRQVNLLKDLGIKTVNGYIVDDIENIKKVVKGLEEKDVELENKFNICYHANQQVCAKKVSVGDGPKFADFIYDPNQKVDQVYTAAVSLAYLDVSTIAALNIDGWRKDFDKLEEADKEKERTRRWDAFNKLKQEEQDEKIKKTKKLLSRLAKQIARLNYEAVIKSAIAEGKKKVYLTLLGCGVFGNEVGWVIDAINNCKNLIEESSLEVIINIADAGAKDKTLYNKLLPLVCNSKDDMVGKFEIFGEQDGKIFNAGDDILRKINPQQVNKKIGLGNGNLISESY